MESSLNGLPPRSLIKIRPIHFVPEKSSRVWSAPWVYCCTRSRDEFRKARYEALAYPFRPCWMEANETI